MQLSSSKLHFWQSDWLANLGISTRQIIVIIILIAVFISGLVLPKIRDNSTKDVFSEDNNWYFRNFQTKVAEIESLYYAEKKSPNPIETVNFQKKININIALEEELITLPGIGPEIAKRILEFRKKNGKFLALEELKKVKGIGEKKFNKVKPYIKLPE